MREGTWTQSYAIHAQASANTAWANMPAAETFLFSSTRHIQAVDVTGMTRIRLKVNKQAVALLAGATLKLRWSPTFSTNVAAYRSMGDGTEVVVNVDTLVNTVITSDWVDIHPDCFVYDDIYLAVIGAGGNGVIDAQFGNISVSVC